MPKSSKNRKTYSKYYDYYDRTGAATEFGNKDPMVSQMQTRRMAESVKDGLFNRAMKMGGQFGKQKPMEDRVNKTMRRYDGALDRIINGKNKSTGLLRYRNGAK